jgi:hypothetical protein
MRSRLGVLLVLFAASACARETPTRTPYYYAPPPWYGYPPLQAAGAPVQQPLPVASEAPLAPAAAIVPRSSRRTNSPSLNAAGGGALNAAGAVSPNAAGAISKATPPPAAPPPPPAWYPQSSTPLAPSIPGGASCLAQLDMLKVSYESTGPTRGVDTPVKARSPLGGVKWTTPGGGPLLADCRLVIALTKIAPELSALGVSEAIYSNAYSYRFTRHGRLSLHARGLAIDVHGVVVFGRRESVKNDFARGLGDGCQPASPVLNRVGCRLRALGLFRELITPDHDADHQDHLHLGIASLTALPRERPLPSDEPNFELVDLGEPPGLR